MNSFAAPQNSIFLERIKLFLILAACFAASYGLYLFSMDNVASGIIWICSALILWVIAFLRTDWGRNLEFSQIEPISKRSSWILFGLIFLIGIFFRVYKLMEIPWGMSIDSATNALEALDILRGASYQPLYFGRETMYFYYLAAFMKIFGTTLMAVRLNSVFWGILTIIPFYFFVRGMFNTQIGLISTFILSTSIYLITYSRSEWRCVQAPFYEFAAFLFLYKAFQKGNWFYWALSGAAVGLGLNTYDSFRFVPVAIGLFLLFQCREKEFLSKNWKGLIVFAICSIIFFGPLGIYAVTHWDKFSARASQTLIVDKVQKNHSLQPLWDNISIAFLAPIYHAQGDFFENQAPLLSPLESLFYLGGVGFVLANFRSRWIGFILLSYLVGLIPGMITFPNSQRLITAIPLTYLMSGLFLYAVIQQIYKADLLQTWKPLIPVYGVVIIFCIVWSYIAYLGPHRVATYGYQPERLVVAQYIKSLQSTAEIIVDRRFNTYQVDFVNYIAGSDPHKQRFETFDIKRDFPFRRDAQHDLIIILEDLPQNRDLLNPLKQLYPDLTTEDIPDHFESEQNTAFAIHIPKHSLDAVHGYKISYYSSTQPESVSFLGEGSESNFPPREIPVKARSASLETQIWIEKLNQYHYQLPSGTISFEIDGRPVDVNNQLASVVLSSGFHTLHMIVGGDLSQIYLLDLEGRPIPAHYLFNLQTPPEIWVGLPIQLTNSFWQRTWKATGGTDDSDHFSRPMSLAVDEQGMIYVGDGYNRRIVKLDSNGKTVFTWSGWGTEPGYLERDIGLGLIDGKLVVSDHWNSRIQIWDTSGLFTGVLVTAPQLYSPYALAILPDDTFLVVDSGNLEVRRFSMDGSLLQNWGNRGACSGCFIVPVGIAYDPEGYVYVTDAGRHELLKFTLDGILINEWHISGITWESYLAVGHDHLVFITIPDENTIYTMTPQGNFLVYSTVGEGYRFFPDVLNRPIGITFDKMGSLYITNAQSNEVIKYLPAVDP